MSNNDKGRKKMKASGLVHKKCWIGAILILLLFCCVNNGAAQEADTWEFDLSIYGWYAGIDSSIKLPNSPATGQSTTIDASDILANLEMIFMGGLDARYNRWSVITDVIYMDVGAEDNQTLVVEPQGVPVNGSVNLDLASWVLHGGIGYDVVQAERGTLAVVGGVRYLTADVDVTLGVTGPLGLVQRSPEQSGSVAVLDGIIGMRGVIKLNENWYLPYFADIGTGGSNLTWQALFGVGYRFSWGDVKFAYRYIGYDFDDDSVLQDLSLSGPLLGVSFRF